MGRSSTFRCETCKKLYYLGYTSYSCWLDYVDTEEEFEAEAKKRSTECREFSCNQNVLKCLREHKGHNFSFVNEDWSIKDNMEVPDDYEDYPKDWESINLENDG